MERSGLLKRSGPNYFVLKPPPGGFFLAARLLNPELRSRSALGVASQVEAHQAAKIARG